MSALDARPLTSPQFMCVSADFANECLQFGPGAFVQQKLQLDQVITHTMKSKLTKLHQILLSSNFTSQISQPFAILTVILLGSTLVVRRRERHLSYTLEILFLLLPSFVDIVNLLFCHHWQNNKIFACAVCFCMNFTKWSILDLRE